MIQGQIIPNSERYEIIKRIIIKYKPKTVLEIGTWKGMGSTKCILDSINDNTDFYTLESNLEFYEISKQNLKNYSGKFKQIFGRIVEVSEVEKFTVDLSLTENQKRWLKEDLNNFNNCPNVFKTLPKHFDLILLDGGEFSTYIEWVKLKENCNIVILDDFKELKCKKIYEELIIDEKYVLLEETNEGNGLCVFKKII